MVLEFLIHEQSTYSDVDAMTLMTSYDEIKHEVSSILRILAASYHGSQRTSHSESDPLMDTICFAREILHY